MVSPPTKPQASGPEDLRARMVEYAPALRRYFQKRAGAAEAEDLVQDVFLAMQARGEAGPIDNIEGYLFRTAAHVLVRRGRRETWDWRRSDPLDEGAHAAEDVSPERALIGKQTLELAIASLEGLPPRMAEAFVLHRFDEMSYAAIARRMGISVKTVENLIARAVKRMIACARARP